MSATRALNLVEDLITLIQNSKTNMSSVSAANGDENYYIGVDCGTASVRAGLVSSNGAIICQKSLAIDVYNPLPDHYEQSSDNIWDQTCSTIKDVIISARDKFNISSKQIRGVGFDATCSLVVLDAHDRPISVSLKPPDSLAPATASKVSNKSNKSNNSEANTKHDYVHNIILWMDHRASQETQFINSKSGHFDVFAYVGGKLSIEMEVPKILWLKNNLAESDFNRINKFMDLADFLTYKATGSDVRSLCTLTCKWTFRSDRIQFSTRGKPALAREGWNEAFFAAIGLKNDSSSPNLLSLGSPEMDVIDKFGRYVANVGESVGNGVNEQFAARTGLTPGCAVGTGMIDAHCGAVGLLGMQADASEMKETEMGEFLGKVGFDRRIALIGGTSTCHMMPVMESTFVPGVWGPYYSALLPKMWLLEGGQSATGALVDYVIKSQPCYEDICAESKKLGYESIYSYLNDYLQSMLDRERKESKGKGNLIDVAILAKDLHVNPYFHGNRSPLANPDLKGMISGLRLVSMDASSESSGNSGGARKDLIDFAALYYLACLQAICYDSRYILETIKAKGVKIECVICTGGLSKNKLFVKLHADISGISIILPKEEDSVLVGGAVLAMVAAKDVDNIEDGMKKLNHAKEMIKPSEHDIVVKYHECKYKVFKKMIDDFLSYQEIMDQFKQ